MYTQNVVSLIGILSVLNYRPTNVANFAEHHPEPIAFK